MTSSKRQQAWKITTNVANQLTRSLANQAKRALRSLSDDSSQSFSPQAATTTPMTPLGLGPDAVHTQRDAVGTPTTSNQRHEGEVTRPPSTHEGAERRSPDPTLHAEGSSGAQASDSASASSESKGRITE